MGKGSVMIIGVGGVGKVTAQKCHQVPEIFSKIVLANRTVAKCETIKELIGSPSIITEQVDANNTSEVIDLIKKHEPEIIINTAMPYQNLTIMDACLETGVHYLDTANYEGPDLLTFSYSWQWDYHKRFKEKGIMALLGCGFDPGVTNIFIAYMKKHMFDRMDNVDIMDCNGGSHGHPFATNFNTEINIREITQKGKYWGDGKWIETDSLALSKIFDFPQVGARKIYLMFHEEMESLVKYFPEVKSMRFWMTFSEEYLTHLRVLENIGLTNIKPVKYEGVDIVPLQFLDHILPAPANLGERTKGKTCIGCLIDGEKDGKPRKSFLYNVCNHEEAFKEVGSQAISYTAGVPPMIGAKLMMEGKWMEDGVFCCEQLDPDPFMDDLNKHGLPWQAIDGDWPILDAEQNTAAAVS